MSKIIYFLAPFSVLLKHWDLIISMVKRDVSSRYKGSVLGVFWSFANPLFMLAMYTFVFQFIFKVKWGISSEGETANYAVILFSGLIFHGWIADVINRSVDLIRSNENLVKKVIFPVEILPWIIVISSLVQFIIAVIVLLFVGLILGESVGFNIIYTSIVIIPFLIFLLGVSYLTSVIGLIVRDVSQLAQPLIVALLFTSTVFFSLEIAPEMIRNLLKINPLTLPVDSFRAILWNVGTLDLYGLAIFSLLSVIFMSVSYYFYDEFKKYYSDII